MKSMLSALLIFSLLIALTSCNNKSTNNKSTSETTHTTSDTESSSYKTSVSSSLSSSSEISSQTLSSETEPPAAPESNYTETVLTEQIIDSVYIEDALPSVAWTEINLDKIMYTQSLCTGYEFALPDAKGKMIYDAGIGLEIIARTSTGYYRTINDYYIPCDCLDNTIPENVDQAAATSCAVTEPVVTTTVTSVAVSVSVSSVN